LGEAAFTEVELTDGVGDTVWVAEALAVAEGVAVLPARVADGIGVDVWVAVSGTVAVAVAEGAKVSVAVAVLVGVDDPISNVAWGVTTALGALPWVKRDGTSDAVAVGEGVAVGDAIWVAVFAGLGVAVEVPVAKTVALLRGKVDDTTTVEVGVAVPVGVAEETPVTGEGGTGVSAKIGVRPANATSCSTGPPPTPSAEPCPA
jgi:hypothetical protein